MKKPELYSRHEAADYLSLKPQTLAAWATNGRYSLPFIKVGRKVVYRREDLDQFLNSRTTTQTL
ncbi:helix-turn-helix domain-containing protein [Vibrio parahaemolyticus]|nr:helix-turn-helix domain-containing protein [Vibrio parahaemolyticus]ELI5422548.1 helix-turn-helix domain-containing protein [Vibrio parahaemolyticus]